MIVVILSFLAQGEDLPQSFTLEIWFIIVIFSLSFNYVLFARVH